MTSVMLRRPCTVCIAGCVYIPLHSVVGAYVTLLLLAQQGLIAEDFFQKFIDANIA